MSRFEIDVSEIREAAADMRDVDRRLARHVPPVVVKGAANIKNQLRNDLQHSTHFKAAARAVSYDIHEGAYFGTGIIEAEIGPEKVAGGNLANIAYFGGAHGGGGTVPDPRTALEAELPNFTRELTALAAEAVFG